jgi:hypothetical protein
MILEFTADNLPDSANQEVRIGLWSSAVCFFFLLKQSSWEIHQATDTAGANFDPLNGNTDATTRVDVATTRGYITSPRTFTILVNGDKPTFLYRGTIIPTQEKLLGISTSSGRNYNFGFGSDNTVGGNVTISNIKFYTQFAGPSGPQGASLITIRGVTHPVIRITGVLANSNYNWMTVTPEDMTLVPSVNQPIFINTESAGAARLPSFAYIRGISGPINAIQISPVNSGRLIHWLPTGNVSKNRTTSDSTRKTVGFYGTTVANRLDINATDFIVTQADETTGNSVGATLFNGVAYVVTNKDNDGSNRTGWPSGPDASHQTFFTVAYVADATTTPI